MCVFCAISRILLEEWIYQIFLTYRGIFNTKVLYVCRINFKNSINPMKSLNGCVISTNRGDVFVSHLQLLLRRWESGWKSVLRIAGWGWKFSKTSILKNCLSGRRCVEYLFFYWFIDLLDFLLVNVYYIRLYYILLCPAVC